MESNIDLMIVESQKMTLLNVLQRNLEDFMHANDQEEFVILLHVGEFGEDSLEAANLIALKVVLEGIIDDYGMDIENVYYKVKNILENENFEVETLEDTYVSGNSGYIYLMINPSMSGVIKIGLTKRTPEERLEELSRATGVPTPFVLVYKEQFNDCVRAEKLIHSILEDRGERVASNREFFNTEIGDAIKIIQAVKKEDIPFDVIEIEEDFYWEDEISVSKEYLEKGLGYLNGYGDYLQDYDKAIEFLERAGELGEAQAYHELGSLFIDTIREDEIKLDVKKAINYFEQGRKLSGKYATYCNAGLALCYTNKYLANTKIKNYYQNDANAEKCWGWFANQIDIGNSDSLAVHYIHLCLIHFLVNEDCSPIYKDILEPKMFPLLKKLRYILYEDVSESSMWDDIKEYLLSQFTEYQLMRKLEIEWLPNDDVFNEERGIEFEVNIKKGNLNENDIICFTRYDSANRRIDGLFKDGLSVTELMQGEKGIIKVSSIVEDFGYMPSELKIKVVGNDVLEADEHKDSSNNGDSDLLTTEPASNMEISSFLVNNESEKKEKTDFSLFGKIKKLFK